MGKSCSKIILLILILAAWIVVTVRAKKTEEGIILTDAYKKQIMESAEWKKIFLHTENYPDILLEDLKRNPEMLEFVEGYNDVCFGGLQVFLPQGLFEVQLFFQ